MCDPHELAVSQPMPAARSAPDQCVRAGLQVVKIITQAGDVDQAVDRQLTEPAEESEIFHSYDDSVKASGRGDRSGNARSFNLIKSALGGFGPALGASAVLAQGKQFVVVAAGLLGIEPCDQLPMDLQVRIAPNR